MLTGARLHLGRLAEASEAFARRAGTERPHAGAAHRRGAGLELRRARPGLVRARALAAGPGGHRARPGAGGDADRRRAATAVQPGAGGDLPRAAAAAALRPRDGSDARRRGRWRSPPSRARRTTAPGRRSWSATPRPSAGPTPRPSPRCARRSTSFRAERRPAPAAVLPRAAGRGMLAAPDGPPRGWRCSTRRWPRCAAATSAGGTPSCTACAATSASRRAAERTRHARPTAARWRSPGAWGRASLALRAATSLARLDAERRHPWRRSSTR